MIGRQFLNTQSSDANKYFIGHVEWDVATLLCELKSADAGVWIGLVCLLLDSQNVLPQFFDFAYTSLGFVER